MKRDEVKRAEVPSGGFPGLTVTRGEEGSRASYRGERDQRAPMTITFRPQERGAAAGIAVFTVLWNAFVAFFLWVAPSVWPCLTPFIATGFFVAYMTAVARFDRLSIGVTQGHLRARHRPLPLVGAFEIACRDVRSIEVEPIPNHETPGALSHLDLVVSTHRGTHRLNVGAPNTTARAHYIAALLREELGLDGGQLGRARIEVPEVTEADEATDSSAETVDEPERRSR